MNTHAYVGLAEEVSSLIDHDNLEEFADPDDYDSEDASDTGIKFYTALAQETGSPVLEIACGTGRVAIPIAQQAHRFAVSTLTPEFGPPPYL